jgi:hypothetical protein
MNLDKFNIVAVDRFFTEKLFSYITIAPDCILDSIFTLFAHLIVLHYRPALRESLIEEIQKKLENGNIKAKCKFVKFCSIALNIVDQHTFVKIYLHRFLEMFKCEKGFQLLSTMLAVIPTIWNKLLVWSDYKLIETAYNTFMSRTKSAWNNDLKLSFLNICKQIRKDFSSLRSSITPKPTFDPIRKSSQIRFEYESKID